MRSTEYIQCSLVPCEFPSGDKCQTTLKRENPSTEQHLRPHKISWNLWFYKYYNYDLAFNFRFSKDSFLMVFHFMRKVCSRSTFILLGKGEMSRFLQQTQYNWILNILETPKCANQFRYKRYWNISVLNVPPKQPKWVCYCWQASILIGTLFLPSFHIAF